MDQDFDAELLAAAGDFDRWPALLEKLADRYGAVGAGLLPALDPSQFRVTPSMIPGFTNYLADGVYIDDPRLALAPLLSDHKVVDDHDVYSPDEIARMSYYQEWLPSQGMGEFVGIRGGTPDDPFVVTLYRAVGDRPFSAEEHRRLEPLSDAVMRAVALDKAVGVQAFAHTVDWHERTPAGVIGLTVDRRVSFVGGTADRYLGASLKLRHERLSFADPKEERAFLSSLAQSDALAHAAALGIPTERTRPDRTYLRARTDWSAFADGSVPMSRAAVTAIDVHPVVEGYRGFVPAAHLLVLSDPFERRRADLSAYGVLWDLTPREAELVGHLCDGRILAECARAMGIREDSARTYLKAIFCKTGARAQSELVALASRV